MLSARPWRSSNEPQRTPDGPSESLGTRRASTALRRRRRTAPQRQWRNEDDYAPGHHEDIQNYDQQGEADPGAQPRAKIVRLVKSMSTRRNGVYAVSACAMYSSPKCQSRVL